MDLVIIDPNTLQRLYIVDQYKSLIWTERYNNYGDFELEIMLTSIDILDKFKYGYYITTDRFKNVMIVEKINMNTDVENGNTLIISGRSFESVLMRRCIYDQRNLTGNLQTCIQNLLNENVINPTIANRKIDNIIFRASADPSVIGWSVDTQFTGDSVYDAIQKMCNASSIAFKITLEDNKFVFELYNGVDRSYDNEGIRPYVVFSPDFDNVIDTEYVLDTADFKNVGIIAGEGEGAERRKIYIYHNIFPATKKKGGGVITIEWSRNYYGPQPPSDGGTMSGLNRYEVFIDARDISSKTDEGEMTDLDYCLKLEDRGKEKMLEFVDQEEFQANVNTDIMYKYNEDFFMGDIVEITNGYGIEQSARVTEYIFSHSDNGVEEYPTFTF